MESKQQHVRFSHLLVIHLNSVIKSEFNIVGAELTVKNVKLLREKLKTKITDIFNKSNHKLDSMSLAWLTDQYFKLIKIKTTSDEAQMADLIFIHEYRLDQLPYHDIELLNNLFNETPMGDMLKEELQRRSQS